MTCCSTSINTQRRKVLSVLGKGNRLVICSPSDSHNSSKEIPSIPTDLDLTKYMITCFTLCMGVVLLTYLPYFEMADSDRKFTTLQLTGPDLANKKTRKTFPEMNTRCCSSVK